MNNRIFLYLIIITVIGACFYFYYKSTSKNNSNPTASENISTNSEVKETEIKPPEKEKISTYEIPILMYHYIREVDKSKDELGANLSVTPAKFDEQMKWLSENNYKSVGFSYLLEPYKVDYKPVIITFDDGYNDAYTNAFPILKKHNLFGVFYIITDMIGYPYYMNWNMIREMNNNNMQFGSHSLSHPDLRNVSDTDLDSQLRYSKNKLEKELDIPISDFCYPSGKLEDRTINKLKELGYKTAVTTKMGIADQDSDYFRLPRRRVQENSDIKKLVERPVE